MAEWNELDQWDVIGGVGDAVTPYLKSAVSAVDELVLASRVMVNE